jgi:hypothetical protein
MRRKLIDVGLLIKRKILWQLSKHIEIFMGGIFAMELGFCNFCDTFFPT